MILGRTEDSDRGLAMLMWHIRIVALDLDSLVDMCTHLGCYNGIADWSTRYSVGNVVDLGLGCSRESRCSDCKSFVDCHYACHMELGDSSTRVVPQGRRWPAWYCHLLNCCSRYIG